MGIIKVLFSVFILCTIYIVYELNVIETLLRDLKFRQKYDHDFIIQKIRNLEYNSIMHETIGTNPFDKDNLTWNPGKITCEVTDNVFNVVKKEEE